MDTPLLTESRDLYPLYNTCPDYIFTIYVCEIPGRNKSQPYCILFWVKTHIAFEYLMLNRI